MYMFICICQTPSWYYNKRWHGVAIIIIIIISNQIVETGSDSLLGPWCSLGGIAECESKLLVLG